MKKKPGTRYAVLIGLCGLLVLLACKPQRTSEAGTIQMKIEAPTQGLAMSVSTPIAAGATVLAAMQAMQQNDQIRFVSQDTANGVIVTSLAGLANTAQGPAWQYALNGQLASLGVADQVLSAGDQIRWCYLSYADRSQCGTVIDE